MTVHYNIMNIIFKRMILTEQEIKDLDQEISINIMKFLQKIKEIVKLILNTQSESFFQINWNIN